MSKLFFLVPIILFLSGCEEKPTIPVLTTKTVSEISISTAVSGGVIINDGGAPVIASGICWGTTFNLTTGNYHSVEENYEASFSSHITNLSPNTLYYVRAYATNSAGTGYGESISFKTFGDDPDLAITNATNISIDSAILNGTINPNLLSTTVTFEWGTTLYYGNTVNATQSPVVGAEPANISIKLTNLSPGTTYHYRIIATNEVGTACSEDRTFKTLGDIPVACSQPASNIFITDARIQGTINPKYLPTTVVFEWGETINYENIVEIASDSFKDDKVVDVFADLSGLIPETTYHYRIKAVNELGTTIGDDLTFNTFAVMDVDSNLYHSVTIGTQIWMFSNLATTHFNDLTAIPVITDNTDWSNLLGPGYCWNENDQANKYSFGALYNWYSVSTGKLCPIGWHVPSDIEWTSLTDYIGGIASGGNKLKETGTIHWLGSNENATNEYGFTAIAAGSRSEEGEYGGIGLMSGFWTGTEANIFDAWRRMLFYYSDEVSVGGNKKNNGYSVRCIKD